MTLSRRSLFACACCAGAVLPFSRARAADPHAHTALTPDEALDALRQGNAAFLRGATASPLSDEHRRHEVAGGQAPFAILVSCSDSRVPPELLFARGLGELFVVRNAGNTVDSAAMGSIEYGVTALGAPLIVVMGHERCGAVSAAVSVVSDNARFPGSIGPMVEPIIPAVLEARSDPGELLDNAVRRNVSRTVRRLREQAPLLLAPQAEGRLKVVGARYDLDDGAVDFFDLPQALLPPLAADQLGR